MGTRCLTIFKEADGEEIAVLYRQIDGHPEGHVIHSAEDEIGDRSEVGQHHGSLVW